MNLVNGVRLDRLVELEGQVVEAVPEAEREKYKYWRAIHLGAVALSYLKGNDALNSAWGAPYAHFQPDYLAALARAERISATRTQFAPEHHQELAALAGLPEDFDYPSMVVALDKSFNDGRQIEHLPSLYSYLDGPELFPLLPFDTPHSPCGGDVLHGRLTADMLDPYSGRALQEIFGFTE